MDSPLANVNNGRPPLATGRLATGRPANGRPANGRAAAKVRGKRSRRRVVMRWLKRGLLAAFAAGVVAMVVRAMLPKPVPVDVVSVARGLMVVTVEEDGRARVKDRYVVSAPISGRLARIELDPADEVQQGAVLARLVPVASPLLDKRARARAEAGVSAAKAARRQNTAQIARAKAALDYAKTQAKRSKELAAGGLISREVLEQALLAERTAQAEIDSARFGARVAAHELEMARAALGMMAGGRANEAQMVVPSPVTGRVLKVLKQSEGVVQTGEPLVELGDPKALEIVVDVLTGDAVRIRPGAVAYVERWGGDVLDARVRVVEPSAFTRLSALGVEEQRVNVIIDVVSPRERWALLGDGYRVEARIVVWQSDDAIMVPASAVFRHDAGWAVYRLDGVIARLQPVAIGQRNGVAVQIVDGLEPPARVVVHPSDRVRDGVELALR